MALNYNHNVYLAVTLESSSPYFTNPAGLAIHPSLSHAGQVGQLRDVQLVSVPKDQWAEAQADILNTLHGLTGVKRVDVQDPPKQRVKRGDDLWDVHLDCENVVAICD